VESRALLEPAACGAERDLVAVFEGGLAPHPLPVDEGPVEAPEVPQDERLASELDDAMLFGDDLVEQLDRVVRMAPQRIDRA
jgi:hypothetical protein